MSSNDSKLTLADIKCISAFVFNSLQSQPRLITR